jgi:hypothetical protein
MMAIPPIPLFLLWTPRGPGRQRDLRMQQFGLVRRTTLVFIYCNTQAEPHGKPSRFE